MRILLFTGIILLAGLFACTEDEPVNPAHMLTPEQVRARADSINMASTNVQELEIEAYLNRKGYTMARTGTGLRYDVYEAGEGDSVRDGFIVQLKFELRLLNDQVCYSNLDSADVKEFQVNMDYVESGLHEAVTFLREGDRARVIMPSPRAHGLLGDMDCIPPLSPILFDLHLVKVIDPMAR